MPEQQGHRLDGKVAIITGASRGLGMYCALAYANEGARVAIVGRTQYESAFHMPGTIHATVDVIEEVTGGQALPVPCDVTDAESVRAMVDTVFARWGRVDVLINNAALTAEGETVGQIPLPLFDDMLRRNVLGPLHTMRAVVPAMRASGGGSIVNISGRSRTPGSPLEATKYAVEAMTLGLAVELRPEGIAVNSLRPSGFISTPGVLLNPEVRNTEVTPPYSYVEASIRLGLQTAATYTGHNATDADVIRDLADEATYAAFKRMNPASWADPVIAWGPPSELP